MALEEFDDLDRLIEVYNDVSRIEPRDKEAADKLARIKEKIAQRIFELSGIEI